ncbi:high mobility group box domain-containing protein, partial [Cunninghamella echinulata]
DSTKSERLKRPPNAYLLFNKEMRRQILNQNDKLTVAEISKILSETWTKLPTERKEYYINKAANLKKQHLEEHPDYVYSRRSKEELEK